MRDPVMLPAIIKMRGEAARQGAGQGKSPGMGKQQQGPDRARGQGTAREASGSERRGMFPAVFRLGFKSQAGMKHAAGFQSAAEPIKQAAKLSREWAMIGGKILSRRGKQVLLVLSKQGGHGRFDLHLDNRAGKAVTLHVSLEKSDQVLKIHAGKIKCEWEFLRSPLAQEAAGELNDSPVAA